MCCTMNWRLTLRLTLQNEVSRSSRSVTVALDRRPRCQKERATTRTNVVHFWLLNRTEFQAAVKAMDEELREATQVGHGNEVSIQARFFFLMEDDTCVSGS